MRKELLATATRLSQTFMPAEHAQSDAALGAAEALVLALKLEKMPGFARADTGPAKEALARGALLSVQADTALREAHREFAKMLPSTALFDAGWGCLSPECGPTGMVHEVQPLRSVA